MLSQGCGQGFEAWVENKDTKERLSCGQGFEAWVENKDTKERLSELTPGTWKPSASMERRKGVELNAKVGDEKAKKFAHTTSLTESKEVHAGLRAQSHFYPAQPEVFYQFTFNYRSRVKLKLMRVIEEPEHEDGTGSELNRNTPWTPAESSNSAQKRIIPKAKFADATDLSEDPPKKSKKRKVKKLLLENALELGDEETKKNVKEEGSGSISKRMKVLGEESQVLRQAIRQLKLGKKIEESSVDLTLDTYDSE